MKTISDSFCIHGLPQLEGESLRSQKYIILLFFNDYYHSKRYMICEILHSSLIARLPVTSIVLHFRPEYFESKHKYLRPTMFHDWLLVYINRLLHYRRLASPNESAPPNDKYLRLQRAVDKVRFQIHIIRIFKTPFFQLLF